MNQPVGSVSARPQTWKSTRRGKIPLYIYKQLAELKVSSSGKETFCVYGVVIDYGESKKSKGTDYFCILRIVDPTSCKDEGTKVTLFHEDAGQLPKAEAWSIIRLHRIKSSFYKGEMSLISARGWSWVMWSGKPKDGEDLPDDGSSSSTSYTVMDSDKQKVQQLRDWIAANDFRDLSQVLEDGVPGEITKLEDVESGKFFNLVCQVTGVAKVQDDFAVLQVWDGTAPSHSIESADIPNNVQVDQMPGMLEMRHYIVDVSVFDNHVRSIEQAELKPGSFVKFWNLHASKKHDQHQGDGASANGSDSSLSSELFLHGGHSFGRDLVAIAADTPEVVQMVQRMKPLLVAEEAENRSEGSLKSPRKRSLSPYTTPEMSKKTKLAPPASEPSPGGNLSEEDRFETPPQNPRTVLWSTTTSVDNSPIPDGAVVEQIVIADSQPSPQPVRITRQDADTLDLLRSLEASGPSRVNFDQQPSQTDTLESETATAASLGNETIRCHQDSLTVVFGDSSPVAVSTISDVTNAHVPVRTSQLFRIRAKVTRLSNPDHLVYYFCPATNFTAKCFNDGKPIRLPYDVHRSLAKWREARGLDAEAHAQGGDRESDSDSVSTQEEAPSSQWFPPNFRGGLSVTSYTEPDTGCHWQTLNHGSDVVRKKKDGRNKFRIVYDSECRASFESLAANHDRVVRVLGRDKLTSPNLPAVAYQDGIYYYCSPGCVGKVEIPALRVEAETFRPERPTQALNCPVLLIILQLEMVFQDEQGNSLSATLKNKGAVDFFNDTTPEQFLKHPDLAASAAEDLRQLALPDDNGDYPDVEVVIEKKSRRSVREGALPVYLYEVVNTRLCQW